MRLFMLGLAIFLLMSCQSHPPECARDSDCQTPGTYLIRSNCPFTSVCDNQQCHVVCQDIQTCTKDSDCSCRHYVASDMKRCACIHGICDAVVME